MLSARICLVEWIASSTRHESYAVILHTVGQKLIAYDNGWKSNPNEVPPASIAGVMPREHGDPRFVLQHTAHQSVSLRILALQFVEVCVEKVRFDCVRHHPTRERRVPALRADVTVIRQATDDARGGIDPPQSHPRAPYFCETRYRNAASDNVTAIVIPPAAALCEVVYPITIIHPPPPS